MEDQVAWEIKHRGHWPHHYRDILDKISSALGLVAVSDTHNPIYPGASMTLQKSFKEPIRYQLTVQLPSEKAPQTIASFEESAELEAVLAFASLIGGWEDKPAAQ